MSPNARVVLDSISPAGDRVTTMELTFHRFVLAEVNTHRVMSKNSASSRAIPVEKQLQRVLDNPAFPVSWPREQPGMQGGTQLEDADLFDAFGLFDDAHTLITDLIGVYLERHPDKSTRVHKSLINRLLEPFMWHTALVTSVLWENFFALRNHPDAQPEFHAMAELAEAAYRESVPTQLGRYEWHIPYIEDCPKDMDPYELLRISAARCARVSVRGFEGERMPFTEDLVLFDKLTSGNPIHSSPLEHQCRPSSKEFHEQRGNLPGFHQFRHDIEDFMKKPSYR